MELCGLLEARAGGLGQFLNIEGPAPILVGGDEVLSGADELGLFLHGHFGFRSWFRLGNQFRTKRPGKGILRGLSDLLFTLDVDGWLFNFK